MKSDSELQLEVSEELKWEPRVPWAEIDVTVRDGVVILSGQVDSYAQKCAAQDAASRVRGVRAVAEDLSIRPRFTGGKTDTELTQAALATIRWDSEVPDETLRVRVTNGWLTLEGTVQWQYQRAAAERAVRYLAGLRGLTNLISLRPDGGVREQRGNIENALQRTGELDAARISVEMHDDTVVLSGTVRSWAERRDAERAAWSAPGVSMVYDRIEIGA